MFFEIDAPRAVAIEIAAIEKPSVSLRISHDEFSEPVADTIVGIDLHDMRRFKLAGKEESSGALAVFVLIQRRMVIGIRDGKIDALVSD